MNVGDKYYSCLIDCVCVFYQYEILLFQMQTIYMEVKNDNKDRKDSDYYNK